MENDDRAPIRRRPVLAASLAMALIAGIVGLAGCGSGGSAAETVVVTETVAVADAASATATPAEGTSDSPTPAAQTLSGSGMKVTSMTVARDTPVVIRGTHNGSSNFIVEILGDGGTTAFNEIGSYSGAVVMTDLSVGKHRVKVDADGAWTLKITQPNPPANATAIPGSIKGKGAAVVWLHAGEDLSPIITGNHKGESNFIVDITAADGSGQENLFNEIGTFSGETTTDVPTGDYLLSVMADGSWSMRFTR